MRKVIVGLFISVLMMTNIVFAADYRVLVIPDNLSSRPAVDSLIYDESAEFFANQVINVLNHSETIEAPTVSEVRAKLAKNQRLNIMARDALIRFKKEYNINYVLVQKLGQMFDVDKVLLITTSADAENYFMRRTFWDFLDIPGAAVIDPAIKLSTYAVLIDTNRNTNLWEDTFYKTISNCESRMVIISPAAKNQQLEKVRDYSRMLAPQIASGVQQAVVPVSMLTQENTIHYGPKNFDNIYTKKYRWYKHGAKEINYEKNYKYMEHVKKQRAKGIEPIYDKKKRHKAESQARKELKQQEKLRLQEEKKQQEEERKRLEEEQKNNEKIIEVKNEKPAEKPVVNKQIKKNEPKVLNITKEDYLQESEPQKMAEPELKYYQPKTRLTPNKQNTTINDI